MSLLLLKTRDLTWQDHTLNTEVMLAPMRSGLLLNKHKTLGAKCTMDKQLFERQRSQCIKDFLSSRRLIDRQRQKLVTRQRELGSKAPRVRSAAVQAKDQAGAAQHKERSASAPGAGTRTGLPAMPGARTGLPAIYIDTGTTSPVSNSDASSFFVTEPPPLLPAFPVPTRISLKSTPLHARQGFTGAGPGRPSHPPSRTPPQSNPLSRNSTYSRERTPTRNQTPPSRSVSVDPKLKDRRTSSLTLQETTNRKPARGSITQRTDPARHSFSVRFADEDDFDEDDDEEEEEKKQKDSSLENKVRTFIDDISQFTTARRLGLTANKRPELWPGSGVSRREGSSPLVAKRYTSFSVDQAALMSAFDQFCSVQTPEELTRAMRLAAKLKANVKVTRNQSIVPSMATFKSSRTFKSLLGRHG